MRARLEAAERFLERFAMLFVLIGLVGLAGLGLKVFAQAQDNHTLAQRVATDEQQLATAQSLLKAQQDAQASSRREATRITCREANEKHRALARGLRLLIAKTPPAKRPHTLAERRQQAEGLVIFINAVAPAYNCAQRVHELNSVHPKHSGKLPHRLTRQRGSRKKKR